jgi:hypothetical protein
MSTSESPRVYLCARVCVCMCVLCCNCLCFLYDVRIASSSSSSSSSHLLLPHYTQRLSRSTFSVGLLGLYLGPKATKEYMLLWACVFSRVRRDDILCTCSECDCARISVIFLTTYTCSRGHCGGRCLTPHIPCTRSLGLCLHICAALLAVVGADAAPAYLAQNELAHLAVMLAYQRSVALRAPAPAAVVVADAGAPHTLHWLLLRIMLAYL